MFTNANATHAQMLDCGAPLTVFSFWAPVTKSRSQWKSVVPESSLMGPEIKQKVISPN